MKKNLGSFFLIICIFLNANLFALEYEWSASANKKEAYVNEAILLKYVCRFSDKNELYTIDFNPVTHNEKYSIKLLQEKERIIDGKRVNSYEYIAYVKNSGTMVFDFDMVMKKTTQESIDSTIGGRDNDVEKEVFTKRYLRQKSISVDILESPVDLVGNFNMEVKKQEPSVVSYKPYNLEIIMKGIGNFENLKAIKFKIDGVKVFSQKPILQSSLKKDGLHGVWSQKFAFVSDENFTIPALEFKYFDTQKKSIQKLFFKSIDITVTRAYEKEELLDEERKGFEFKIEYIYYLLAFILGFIFAKIKIKKSKKIQTKEELFCTKVRKAKSLEKLSVILAVESTKKYEKILLKIEKKELTSLKDAKKLICS